MAPPIRSVCIRCHNRRIRTSHAHFVIVLILLLLDVMLSPCLAWISFPIVTHSLERRRRRSTSLCMVSSSNSKTGGRLLESVEEYTTLVDNASAERPVLVFWTAPWCGPCRLSIPVVKDVIKALSGKIEAVEVCTDDLPEVAADAGVLSIPTIHIYFRGKLLDTLVGCVAKQVLVGSVEKVLEDIAIQQKVSSPRKDVLGDTAT